MHSHRRRLRRDPVELNITAFMNLIVVLVPFLLTTVVFSRVATLEVNLPAAAAGPVDIRRDLQLEITIRPDAFEVGDRNSGLIQRIASNRNGYDYQALSELIQGIKARFPQKAEATILLEPGTAYDTLVQVMDTVRNADLAQGGAMTSVELFPDISIGDAPRAAAGRSS